MNTELGRNYSDGKYYQAIFYIPAKINREYRSNAKDNKIQIIKGAKFANVQEIGQLKPGLIRARDKSLKGTLIVAVGAAEYTQLLIAAE